MQLAIKLLPESCWLGGKGGKGKRAGGCEAGMGLQGRTVSGRCWLEGEGCAVQKEQPPLGGMESSHPGGTPVHPMGYGAATPVLWGPCDPYVSPCLFWGACCRINFPGVAAAPCPICVQGGGCTPLETAGGDGRARTAPGGLEQPKYPCEPGVGTNSCCQERVV